MSWPSLKIPFTFPTSRYWFCENAADHYRCILNVARFVHISPVSLCSYLWIALFCSAFFFTFFAIIIVANKCWIYHVIIFIKTHLLSCEICLIYSFEMYSLLLLLLVYLRSLCRLYLFFRSLIYQVFFCVLLRGITTFQFFTPLFYHFLYFFPSFLFFFCIFLCKPINYILISRRLLCLLYILVSAIYAEIL